MAKTGTTQLPAILVEDLDSYWFDCAEAVADGWTDDHVLRESFNGMTRDMASWVASELAVKQRRAEVMLNQAGFSLIRFRILVARINRHRQARS